METIVKEKSSIKGRMVVSVFDTSSPEADKLDREMAALVEGPRFAGYHAKYKELLNALKRFVVREYAVDNLITTEGRAVLAARLANDTTYTGIINYGVLGSSATAPTNADSQMTTEVFRKVVASASDTDNVAFIDFFYSKADTNGTYQEFGTFIDGTGSANTGQMFTHALTGGWTKSASESMTVSCQYTIT
jgi:hypothetical protein